VTVLVVLMAVVTSRPGGANQTDLGAATGSTLQAGDQANADPSSTASGDDPNPVTPEETIAPETTETTVVPVTTVVVGPSGPAWPGPGQVALTFDDGPDPTWTQAILDTLARYNVPATFFVIGSSVERYPELVTAMVNGGHSVQNHTWGHPYLTQFADDGIAGQLSGTDDVIEGIVGKRPTCYRPPYGAADARVDAVAASVGLTKVMWNVAPNDYLSPPPQAIVDNVVARAGVLGPASPLVVVLHDGGGNRQATLDSLPGMIEALSAAGYSFVSVC
jgi:peptidoglycan/xylan/chitin deacetylase (PgdA/CDA1 family)